MANLQLIFFFFHCRLSSTGSQSHAIIEERIPCLNCYRWKAVKTSHWNNMDVASWIIHIWPSNTFVSTGKHDWEDQVIIFCFLLTLSVHYHQSSCEKMDNNQLEHIVLMQNWILRTNFTEDVWELGRRIWHFELIDDSKGKGLKTIKKHFNSEKF